MFCVSCKFVYIESNILHFNSVFNDLLPFGRPNMPLHSKTEKSVQTDMVVPVKCMQEPCSI